MTAIKISIVVFLLVTSYLLLVPAVSAQTLPATGSAIPATVSPTSPLYTDLLVHNLFHTASCIVAGRSAIGQPCLTYQISQDAQGRIKSIPYLSQTNFSNGILGAESSLLGALYTNPPIRAADYLAVLGEDLGIREAHAQVGGSGNLILNPIVRLWQVSRNISYLFMILVFVIIGLMVMFRQRINPQTVVTAQSAIPGLVIGLILITFSYFLGALLVDIAFVGTNVMGYYFVAAQTAPPPGASPPPTNLVQAASGQNVFSIMGSLMNGIGKDPITKGLDFIYQLPFWPALFIRGFSAALGGFIGSVIGPFAGQFLAVIACALAALGINIALPGVGTVASLGTLSACTNDLTPVAGPIISTAITTALALFAVGNPSAFLGVILWFLAMVVLVYTMFRLILRLINNFLSIIFLVVTAPFHFLAASMSGRQSIATDWILNMLCNVLAFPAVMTVFYFVNYLLGSADTSGSPFNIVSPTGTQITGSNVLPLFGGLDLSFIRILLAFGALVASPAIPEIICRTIGRVGVAGQLIGQEIGANLRGQRYWEEAAERGGAIGRTFGGAYGVFRPERRWEYSPGRDVYIRSRYPSPMEILRSGGEAVPIPEKPASAKEGP